MKDLSVKRSREHEAPACLALLPEIIGTPAELLIARIDGAFAGAAAVLWANWSEPPGFRVHVKVLTGARRQGVGRALIEAAANLADGETDGLWSLESKPFDSPAAKFMEKCGFVARNREHHFRVNVEALRSAIEPIVERCRESERIPKAAEVVYLSEAEAPLDEIAWLVAREFNSNPILGILNLRQRRDDDADGSVFARLDGEVVGVLLCHERDGVATVDARVVSKRWRYGWPNLVMLEKVLRDGQLKALQQAQFYCDDTVNDTDTKNLVRRAKGEEVDLKARYYLALD
jgi:GNAT superfamily N-acetyltransferase